MEALVGIGGVVVILAPFGILSRVEAGSRAVSVVVHQPHNPQDGEAKEESRQENHRNH